MSDEFNIRQTDSNPTNIAHPKKLRLSICVASLFFGVIWPIVELVYSSKVATFCRKNVLHETIDIRSYLIADAVFLLAPFLGILFLACCSLSLFGCLLCPTSNVTKLADTDAEAPSADSDSPAVTSEKSDARYDLEKTKPMIRISICSLLISAILFPLGIFATVVATRNCTSPIVGIVATSTTFRGLFCVLYFSMLAFRIKSQQ